MLEPRRRRALDEIDSGLDIDRLQDVSKGINALRDEQGTGVLQITHYQRILDYVEPDHVHVMLDGEVVKKRRCGTRREARGQRGTTGSARTRSRPRNRIQSRDTRKYENP